MAGTTAAAVLVYLHRDGDRLVVPLREHRGVVVCRMRRDAAAALVGATAAAVVVWWLRQRRRQRYTSIRSAVEIISSVERAEQLLGSWLPELRSSPVGIDVEWVGKGPPALLQLCAIIRGERRCVLLRLCHMRGAAPPPALLALLADPTILKAGVSVTHDLRLLEAALGASPRSGTELAPLAAAGGFEGRGLRSMAWSVLGVRLEKSTAIACSDWEAPALEEAQIRYAAEDASVSLALLLALYVTQPSRPLSHATLARHVVTGTQRTAPPGPPSLRSRWRDGPRRTRMTACARARAGGRAAVAAEPPVPAPPAAAAALRRLPDRVQCSRRRRQVLQLARRRAAGRARRVAETRRRRRRRAAGACAAEADPCTMAG